MDVEDKSVPLTKDSEIPPPRTDDPEYFWSALVVLVTLSVVIMVILYKHDYQDDEGS